MADDKTKPGWAFWATVVVVVVLAGYPLSFGPACRMAENGTVSVERIESAFRPVIDVMHNGPRLLSSIFWNYAHICCGEIFMQDFQNHLAAEAAAADR
jgi:hypothetical protein